MNKERWSRRLGIKLEDRRKLWLLVPVFLLCGIAEAMNYNGYMTLFNQRFGSSYLPYVYIAEAAILPAEAWFMAWLAGRLSKPGLMRTMYGIMTGIVLVNAVALLTMKLTGVSYRPYYPFLFLTSSFVVRQQTILLWSLAVDLCPTQQAKRLMPLFVAAATMGGIVAGVLAQVVSPAFGPDIVYVLGPVFLLIASVNYRKAISVYLVPLTLKHAGDSGTAESLSSTEYFRRTLRSPFLLSVLGLMTLMPALYFLMEYLFLNTAHATFSNEADFGRMFGIVTTALFAMAFLLQVVSGRLMAWLGASGMLTAIAGVYVLCFFGSWLLLGSSAAIVAVSGGYMLAYLLIYYSAEPSYQLFYKILPLEQRDGFRYVSQGVATFAGILLGAGLQFLHTGFGVGFGALAGIGSGVAGALLLLSWFLRRLYMKELVRSVQTIGMEEKELAETFGELSRNSRAMGAVHAMLKHESAEAREIALTIIGHRNDPRNLPLFLELLGDRSARVRSAALRAMNLEAADLQAMVEVAALLEDPEPDVRAEVVHNLARMKHMTSQAFFFLRMKLLDSDPSVVAEAVKAMYSLESAQSYEACSEVLERMLADRGEPAVQACRVIGELRLDKFADSVEKLLEDSPPSVRVAATSCLGSLGRLHVVPKLLERLPAADLELRRATATALADMGEGAAELLKPGLAEASPVVWSVSATALAKLLTDEEVRDWLADQCVSKLTDIEEAATFPEAFRIAGRKDLAELAELRLRDTRKSVHAGAWAVLERLTDEHVVEAIRRAASDPDEETRGGGLEVLAEGVGDRRLSQRLAFALEAGGESRETMTLEDARETIERAGRTSDDWWREMAADWRLGRGGSGMEELGMLGRLNKVVFLKKVPFFADLSLEELGLIAGAATERKFADGEYLLTRGEPNPAMYVVVGGNVELTSLSAAGWEGTLGVLGPGEVCGATSALDESPSTVAAQAFFGDVLALALEREDVTRLVRLYPEIGIGLLRASLARIRLLEEMMMKIDS